jgi:hypothetical protein
MAAPTNAANVKKVLVNSEPSTHGTMRGEEVVPTEAGAHTLALDRKRNKLYAFLPQSHRAAVFVDMA